jgi:lysophospholipase L1-like esterase
LVDAAGPISTTAKAGIGAFHLSGTWSRFFTGSMAYAHVSNVAWSATDVESAYLYMVRSLAPRGIAFPSSGVVAPPSNIVFDGDSLTFGYSLVPVSFDTKYPTLVARSYAPNPAWANIGIPSQTMRTMAAGVAANIVPLYQPRAKTNVLVVWAGTNDILAGTTAAVTHGYLQTYCLAAQAAGWKVVVLTMLPAASPSTVRDPTAYNTLIRANWTGYANALADVGADSRLSTTSATYFQADNLHINGSGMSVVAGIVQAAINSVVTP